MEPDGNRRMDGSRCEFKWTIIAACMRGIWFEFLEPMRLFWTWCRAHFVPLLAAQVLILGIGAYVYVSTPLVQAGSAEIWMKWPATNQLSFFFEELRDAELNGHLPEFWQKKTGIAQDLILDARLRIPQPGEPKTLDSKKFVLDFTIGKGVDYPVVSAELKDMVSYTISHQAKIKTLVAANQTSQGKLDEALQHLRQIRKAVAPGVGIDSSVLFLENYFTQGKANPVIQTQVQLDVKALTITLGKSKRMALLCIFGLEGLLAVVLLLYFLLRKGA